jgi:hypothetical protein
VSIFGRAWNILKGARHVVGLIAAVGPVTLQILGIKAGSVPGGIVDAAKKAERAADAVEEEALKPSS